MESILLSIKKLLGIAKEYKHFDEDIIMHINSVLSILTQIGVGPSEGFSIEGDDEMWTDFIQQTPRLDLVKSYMHQKVKMLFDPPISSAAIEASGRILSELEWRIQVITDPVSNKSKEEIQNE